MNYCDGEKNVASTLCDPCPYDHDCEKCKEEMKDTELWLVYAGPEYAAEDDFVFVEIKLRNSKSVVAPASIVLSQNGGYEVQMIGNTIVMSEETYGKTWRCWSMSEPGKEVKEKHKWDK